MKINGIISMNDNEYSIYKLLSDSNYPGFPKVYSKGFY